MKIWNIPGKLEGKIEQINSKVKKKRVVVFVRFSHIQVDRHPFKQHGGAIIDGKVDVSKKAEFLFSEQRMEERFRYFESLCLPSLDAQKDRDFVVCLRCSELLPRKWKKRLYSLLKDRDYIYTYFLPTAEDAVSYERKLLRYRLISEEKGAIITARLDDDDALSNDYIARLKKYLKGPFFGHVISFPVGFYIKKGSQKDSCIVMSEKKPYIAAGLAMVSGRDRLERFIMSVRHNHLKIDEIFPVVLDSRSPAYIVSAHEHNDSERSDREVFHNSKQLGYHEADELICEKFPTVKMANVFGS